MRFQNKIGFRRLSAFGVVLFLLWGCKTGDGETRTTSGEVGTKPFLVIYCENSMVPVLVELEKQFEKKHFCEVKIINDCSQNLIGLVNFSKQGDLFLPDASSAFLQLRRKSDVSIVDSVLLGYNQLLLFVAKNNPKNITGDMNVLLRRKYSVAMANPETSSLGYETRKMLDVTGNYKFFLKNMVSMTIDSKGLDKMVYNNKADYAFGWSTMVDPTDPLFLVDTVAVEPVYVSPVYLGVMSCSQNRIFAKYFMDFVSSGEHSEQLQRNGLRRRRTQVF